jgi:hypothetical protein
MRGHRDTVDPESASKTADIKKKRPRCISTPAALSRAGNQPAHALHAARLFRDGRHGQVAPQTGQSPHPASPLHLFLASNLAKSDKEGGV